MSTRKPILGWENDQGTDDYPVGCVLFPEAL